MSKSRARSGKKKVPVWSDDRGAEGAEPSAEGARIEAPKVPKGGWGGVWGYPPLQPTRRSGAGSGAEPWSKTILVRSEGARTALVAMHATEMT